MQWFLDSSKRQVLKVKTARYTLAGRGGAGHYLLLLSKGNKELVLSTGWHCNKAFVIL